MPNQIIEGVSLHRTLSRTLACITKYFCVKNATVVAYIRLLQYNRHAAIIQWQR